MKFIDIVNIRVRSGNAGNTIISFKKQKRGYRRAFISYGGDGGDVWLVTNRNINTLSSFFFKRMFCAENGENGWGRGCRGRAGKSIFIQVPVGTRVYSENSDRVISDLIYNNQQLLVVKGGKRTSLDKKLGYNKQKTIESACNTHISGPLFKIIRGNHGEICNIKLELLLLADVGLLGLPNAGKSSLVQAVSAAKTRIADYPFTTVFPCLGVVYTNGDRFVIADIPGLIKGASIGLGLGINFLKHLQRCRMLLHVIDIIPIKYSDILENVRIIINELESYSTKLACKPIWLVFNKIDLLDQNEVNSKIEYILSSLGWKNKYYLISAKNKCGVKKLCQDLIDFIHN